MIVTDRAPRRKRSKPAQPGEIASPRVVKHLPKWQCERKPLSRDAQAEAEIIALFRRMGMTVPDDLFDR